MDSMDAAEVIRELQVDRAEAQAEDRFQGRVALIISMLATLLAITSLSAGNVAEEMIHANIKASDTWAFFQAKNVRQTQYKLALDELELRLATDVGLSPEKRAELEKRAGSYRETIARYESEPDAAAPNDPARGEGKRQLLVQAQGWEAEREIAAHRDANFDFSEVFFQIAIVLGSVAILATSRKVLWIALGMGAVATVLMANGYLLLFRLPI